MFMQRRHIVHNIIVVFLDISDLSTHNKYTTSLVFGTNVLIARSSMTCHILVRYTLLKRGIVKPKHREHLLNIEKCYICLNKAKIAI